jgi:asparagine synthase (glutamine-hydrolysing)
MTRGFVTVALSGDGGDELFYGYHRYFLAEEIWRKVGFLPPFARRAIARGLKPLGRFGRLGDRLAKASQALEFRYPEELYARLISLWQTPDRAVLDSNEPLTIATDPDLWLKGRDFASSMQFIDALCYLADDILTKVDRAAMGVSLETRAPFLDHRIAEFAARLPRSLKSDRRGVRETFRLNTQNDGGGKRVLREVLYRFVPRELIDRPKMGFGVPIERWLRKDLREMADDLLSESRLKNEGFFDHEPIVKMWREHKAGDRAWHYALWHILIFELWLKENKAS